MTQQNDRATLWSEETLSWKDTSAVFKINQLVPPLTAIVIEDQEGPRKAFLKLLALTQPEVQVLGTAVDVPSARAIIQEHSPQVIFLDIELGDQTGFDLLRSLGDRPPLVIFTTGNESYALNAIRFSALDFLVKPVGATELDMAVKKARTSVWQEGLADQLKMLLNNLSSSEGPDRRIALPLHNGHKLVPVSDILYGESDGNYTTLIMRGGTRSTVSRSIGQFEEMLRGVFIRVHNEHLVNKQHIDRYVKGEGGEVIMSDGRSITVSRRKKQELMEALGLG